MDSQPPLVSPPRLAWVIAVALTGLLLAIFLGLPRGDGFTPGHRTLLSHIAVYDPSTGGVEQDRDLLWQDGRIAAVAPGGSLDAAGGLGLDCRGFCAMPALADAAVFLSLEGRYPGDSVPAGPEQSLRLQAASGMGGVLDLNASRAFMHLARALDGVLPRVRFAGALFTAPGGWRALGQAPWDSHIVEVQEEDDLYAPWSRALRFQDQAVFASVEDEGRDGLSIPLPVLARLGALAHERGLPFIVQANHASKALTALDAKPDAMLGPLFNLDEAPGLPQAMRRAGCAYIPALGSVLNAYAPAPLGAWLRSFPAAQALGATVLAQADEPQAAGLWLMHWTRQGIDPATVRLAAKGMADAGVRIVFGTGSGLPLVFHGLGAQAEVALLLQAGLSPRQILESATLNSHALAGLEGGSLRKGDPADVLLVSGDPVRDASVATHPVRVFLGGVETAP